MPYVHTPGLDIHFEEAGAGPDVLVLLHGNFASWRWWKQVLQRLPPGFHAYAPDLRGCGDTAGGRSIDAYRIPQLGDDLLELVRSLGLGSFHLVGHSLGGAVALQFALQHPGRVRSLTLVAPAPATGLVGLREGSSASARILRQVRPEHGPSMAVLHHSYRMHHALGTHRWMLRSALARLMPTAALARSEAAALLADAVRMSPDAVVGFLLALHRWNVAGELGSLAVPTLVLGGGKDVVVPAVAVRALAQLVPRSELLVWSHVGHSPHVERPDEFVRLLVAAARRSPAVRVQSFLRLRASNDRRSLAGPGAEEPPLRDIALAASVALE